MVTKPAYHRPAALKILLEKRGRDIRITDFIILAAEIVKLYSLKLMLETRRRHQHTMIENIVLLAVRPTDRSRLLFDKHNNKVRVNIPILGLVAKCGETRLCKACSIPDKASNRR